MLERKNAFLGYKKKKLKNWKFPFFHVFFLGNLGQENVFYDILEQKNAFLGYKNKKFKQEKTWHFSKGVSPWFSSRIGHFSLFVFLGNLGQLFYNILEQKKSLCRLWKEEVQKLRFFPTGLA